MLKANTTIILGGKKYCEGQAVTGLSSSAKEWMKKAGYVTEAGRKETAVATEPEEKCE